MAAHNNDVICLHVQDADQAVKIYQDQGCTVKRHSKKGTFLDCADSQVFNADVARDEARDSALAPLDEEFAVDLNAWD